MFGAVKRSLVCLGIGCLVLAVAGCGGAQSRKARHLEKGQAFLASGNFDKARVEFRNALQIVPTDSEARYENGVVSEKLGNLREAAQFYQGAIDSDENNIRARASLGRLYLLSGAPEKAMSLVTPGFAKHPDDPNLLTVRAAARIQLKDVDGALQDARRAVQLAPTNEDAISVLAGIYRAQNQTDKAQSLLQGAIKQSPGTVDLRLVLAQLYASLGKQAELEALLLELVKLKPDEKAHRLRLAQFYSHTDHIDEAERVLREGVKAMPEERDLKTALIEFLAARRSRAAAEQELTAMIAQNPKDYGLRFIQAGFYEQGKDYPKAQAVYEEVIGAAKTEAAGITARDRLAALRVQLNDIPGAEKLIAEVLAQSPRDDDALIMRGNLALTQKDPRTAIADLRSVLRDQPNAIGVMRSLARAHLANGEPALAEETMRRAVEANPNDPGARLDFAELLTQLGKAEQAKPIIDGLVKQQPDNMQALDVQYKVARITKDTVTAKAAADAMVATQPKNGLGHYDQGLLAESDKRYDDALRHYSTSLDLEPDATQPLEGIVRVLVGLKRVPDALQRLDEVVARLPQAPFAVNLKGEVLVSNQRAADAIAAFNTAIERAPRWWIPYRNIAVTQSLVLKNNEAALAILRTGIDKVANPDPLVGELANLYERMGKIDDAIQAYEGGLRRDPKSEIMANNLAMMLVTYKTDSHSLDRAKELAARFSGSPNPSFLDTYGWVLYKRGDATAAVAALQDSLIKAPNQPVSLYHLGMALVRAGQVDAARDSLTKSLQSGKSFYGMDEAKATLDKLAKDAPLNAAPSKS